MALVYVPGLNKTLKINDNNDSIVLNTKEELNEFLRFYCIDDPTTKPVVAPNSFLKVYKRNINSLLLGSIPWADILPESIIENFINEFTTWWLKQKFPNNVSEFYNSYVAENNLYENIVPLTINKTKYEKHYNETQKKESFLEFNPNNNELSPIKYSRNTTTGRMVVSSGPNLLVLPKEQRDMIESKNGCLLYADFCSLEPNVLLFVTKKIPTEQFYENLTKIINVERKVIKQGYLATIYGAGFDKIANIFQTTEYKAKEISSEFNSLLGIEELRESIIENWYKNEKRFIENFFGQRIRTIPNETPEYKLLSLYLQSTATEMAIRMFSFAAFLFKKQKLLSRFSGIIHDGAFIDCKQEEKEETITILKKIGFLFDKNRPFPITIEEYKNIQK